MKPFTQCLTKAFTLILVFFSMAVYAGPERMSEAQMQQMMEQAKAAQACMKKVDQSKLEALDAEGQKVQSKIKMLCEAGKRDEAQSTAMEYGLKMKDDPAFKEMAKCGQMMRGAIPESYTSIKGGPNKGSHVCDAHS